jgi:hypothetical protein
LRSFKEKEKRNTEAGRERQSLEFQRKDKRSSVRGSSRRRKERTNKKGEGAIKDF